MGNIIHEVLKVLKRGPFTEKYPKAPSPAAEEYRGKPIFDPEKCIGCGACAKVCPVDAIDILDGDEKRVLKVNYGTCIFCGKCQEKCLYDAITLTKEFEISSSRLEDAVTTIEIPLKTCKICGGPVTTLPQMAEIEKILEKEKFAEDIKEALELCIKCRLKKYGNTVATKLPYLRE